MYSMHPTTTQAIAATRMESALAGAERARLVRPFRRHRKHQEETR